MEEKQIVIEKLNGKILKNVIVKLNLILTPNIYIEKENKNLYKIDFTRTPDLFSRDSYFTNQILGFHIPRITSEKYSLGLKGFLEGFYRFSNDNGISLIPINQLLETVGEDLTDGNIKTISDIFNIGFTVFWIEGTSMEIKRYNLGEVLFIVLENMPCLVIDFGKYNYLCVENIFFKIKNSDQFELIQTEVPETESKMETSEFSSWEERFEEFDDYDEDLEEIDFKNITISYDIGIDTLYAFLQDSEQIVVSDMGRLLSLFSNVHNLFVEKLYYANNKNLIPPFSFMKSYHKFRHNVFSSICLFFMGLENFKLSTDIPLSKYLPNSNKTPDFILETEQKIILFEFTVGNTYESVEFIKGGGNIPVKYTDEAKEISLLRSKLCQVKIVPAVLNEHNHNEIFMLLKDFLIEEAETEMIKSLRNFFNICNSERSIINNNNTSSQIHFKTPQLELDNFDYYDRPFFKSTIMVSPVFLSSISNCADLLPQILRMMSTKVKKILLCYEVDNNRLFLRKDKRKGQSITLVKNAIVDMDIDWMLKNISVFDDGKLSSFEKIRGTVPLSFDRNFKKTRSTKWSFVPLDGNLYNLREPIKEVLYPDEMKKISIDDFIEFGSHSRVLFPPDYFKQLCGIKSEIFSGSQNKKMLGNNTMNTLQITEAMDIFCNELDAINNKIDVFRPKPTFIMPFVSEPLINKDLDDLNEDMMIKYMNEGTGIYTKTILKKILKKEFIKFEGTLSLEISKAKSTFRDAQKNYIHFLKSKNIIKPFKLMTLSEKRLVKDEKMLMDDANKKLQSLFPRGKGILGKRMIKLKCGKNSLMKKNFDYEMEHFNLPKSTYHGVGSITPEESQELSKYFIDLSHRLIKTNFQNCIFSDLYNKLRSPGPDFLTNLKNNYTSDWDEFQNNFFKGTLIEQLTEFNSRLSNFLFNESVKTYNRDYVKVDNLGFDNILVLVKGGSKIYKNQTTRLFKVFFYVDNNDLKYTGYKDNQYFEKINMGNNFMIVTPWSQIRQDILFDYISLRFKTFMNLYSTYTRIYTGFDEPIPEMLLLPSILSLHNRRKTEEFMHNCRYLIVNPLGQFSNIAGIVEGFATFNYTFLDAWLKSRVQNSYTKFANNFLLVREHRQNIDNVLSNLEISDLWFDKPIINSDMLTAFIYITYMMTKSAVNSSIEQANNLWNILDDINLFEDTHSDVDGLQDWSLHSNVLEFDSEIYEDDFKYDPVFCQYLGHHMGGYLLTQTNPIEIQNQWERIKKEDLDSIANSNGLRGWNEKNFFGKKGYEVVYEKISDLFDDEEIISKIEGYLESDHITTQENIVRDRVKLPENSYKDLMFHIVHKIQRGGGREIFCMDLNTKSLQNPLEKLFKFICKKIPNEFISIPSNKRHNIIHSDFYEKKPGAWVDQIVRWVLDCRRWAPHSVFQKFYHFIAGLSPILPPDFIDNFKDFTEGMFSKKFLTRNHVISKMVNNARFSKYKHLITKMNGFADGLVMTVKFSFVMGIFNYLSTLMHSANQLVASEVIRNIMLKEGKGLVIMDPKCHSDDSVLTTYHEKKMSIKPSVLLYDWLLKNANHMLSVKKSQVNYDVYLEFLSILYVMDRFLPVTPKFTSSLPFQPTDNGYSSDITFAVSQSIELLSQGGSLDESFLIMKLTEKHIQRIYNIKPVDGLPFNFLGHLDSHPVELLMGGGLSELAKYFKYAPDTINTILSYLTNEGLIDLQGNDFNIKWDMSYKLDDRLKKKFNFLQPLFEKFTLEMPWTLENAKFGNGVLNLLWYYHKLSDSKFYGSLIDDPIGRKFSRIVGSANYRMIKNQFGDLIDVSKLNVVLDSIIKKDLEITLIDTSDSTNFIENISKELYDFYNAIEGTTIVEEIISNIKEKPIHFSIGSNVLSSVRISATDFVIYVKEPEAYKLLGKFGNPSREVELICQHLKILDIDIDKLSPSQLLSIVRKLLKHKSYSYSMIAATSGDKRKIEGFSDIIDFIGNASKKRKKLILKNKKAVFIDWEKKMVNGKVPSSVTDYMKEYLAYQLFYDYNMLQHDIFDVNPESTLLEKKKQIPDEWKPILLSSLEGNNKPLIDVFYWFFWEKEQTKILNHWYGEGVLYCNLPEAALRFHFLNNKSEGLKIETSFSGLFPISTSWFLSNLINFSNLKFEMISSDYADPSKKYFGYNNFQRSYGIGYCKNFDTVFEKSEIVQNLLPGFCYSVLPRKQKGRYWYYVDNVLNKHYKIEFFIPIDEKIKISVSKYLNHEKVKTLVKNDKIQKFLQNMSADTSGLIKYEYDYLFDNIGRSLIYNIVRQTNFFMDIYTGNYKGENPLLDSMFEWKKLHPDFGFPSMEELNKYLTMRNVPNLPPKIFKMLLDLGQVNITGEEYDNIIAQLLHTPIYDRDKYLLSQFPILSTENAVNSIVISIRSDRIYDTCKWLRRQSITLISPLLETIGEIIENKNLISNQLEDVKMQLELKLKKKIKSSDLFLTICSRFLLNGVMVNQTLSKFDQLQERIMIIIDELIDVGLLNHMNNFTHNKEILRTVEFMVEKDKFIGWVIDIFDSYYLSPVTRPPMRVWSDWRKSIREGGQLSPLFSSFRNYMVKMNITTAPKLITIKFKNKKQKKIVSIDLKLSQSIAGITNHEFQPLNENDQEEFEDALETGDDAYDDLELTDPEEISDYGFTKSPYLDLERLTGVRGGAWNMFIHFHFLNKDCLMANGVKRIFEKGKRSVQNIYNWIDSECDYIFFCGVTKKKIEIEGYSELNWETISKRFRISNFTNDKIVLEGVERTKLEVLDDPGLRSKLSSFETYFKNISTRSLMKEAKVLEKQYVLLKENIDVSKEFQENESKLHDLIEELDHKNNQNDQINNDFRSKASEILSKIDLRKIITAGEMKKTDSETKKSILKQKDYHFSEQLNLLTDVDFRSEFETLFPGYWEKLINNDIRLSEKTIKMRLEYAKLRINRMPKYMRQKYRKLYLIIAFVLKNIQVCKHREYETLEFGALIDDLFDIDFDTDEEETDLFDDLMSEAPEPMQIDFDYL